jgi:hypothetical protein
MGFFIMENQEIWKDIPGYEGIYQASSLGNIKRIKKNKLIASVLDKNGYCSAHLCKNGKGIKWRCHRLIVMAFIGISKQEVDHINGIKTDNRLENLEYVSKRENQLRCKERIGTKSKLRGVSWHKQNSKWQSEIRINNKRIYLGTFKTELEAHLAYINKLKEIENVNN